MNNYNEGKVCTDMPVEDTETIKNICALIYASVRQSFLIAQGLEERLYGKKENESEREATNFKEAMTNLLEYANLLEKTLKRIVERTGI